MNPDEKGQIVDPTPEITLSGPFTVRPQPFRAEQAVMYSLRLLEARMKEMQSRAHSSQNALRDVFDALSTSLRANPSRQHGHQ